jgi:hypothetical protein
MTLTTVRNLMKLMKRPNMLEHLFLENLSCLIYVSKARANPRNVLQLGRLHPTHKYSTMLAKDKQSSLFDVFVSGEEKKSFMI